MTRAVIRRKGQITLPREVREALHVEEGDDVAFTVEEDGTVVLTGLKSTPADQAWFWTDEWQAGEREASRQAARGEGTVYDGSEDFLDSLS
ncbi:MAG: AbrB/MazE/SpoVT family DNA-binding domain-containing protein [Thermoanaerobaculia bacterium]